MAHIVVFDAGRMVFQKAWNLQKNAVRLVRAGIADEIYVFVEHDPVYTTGIHSDGSELDEIPEIIKLERGGSVTFHGPGQIVVYPIVDLSRRKITIKDLILSMHRAEISFLADYGIEADGKLDKQTGVWVGPRKISSTGFYISGSITMHGIALNLNTEMSYFRRINPCGFSPDVMTSVEQELGTKIDYGFARKSLWSKIKEEMEISECVEINGTEELLKSSLNGLLSETVL